MIAISAKFTLLPIRYFAAVAAITAFAATLVTAQTFFGSIVGTVTDSSGAGVAASKVTLTTVSYTHLDVYKRQN